MGKDNPFCKLWKRARSGDRDAQADLYLEYGPHLRRVIRLKLRDLKIEWAVEPDDVLDSFFIRLYNGGAKISFNDALHSTNYCEQALRNKCVQVLRRVIPRLATSIEDCPPELLADPHATTDEGTLEWDERLEQAYSRLTHREREICWLELEGLTWEEIGARLNISPAAVKKAHQRATDRVRDEILDRVGVGIEIL
ncbi:MAG: sigma-70 family RNA polymerase sigma factor [Planctomycetota bacterium]|nr:sigma-70 family RNA polymerase sigma factor [Planctomycetota bacterium]